MHISVHFLQAEKSISSYESLLSSEADFVCDAINRTIQSDHIDFPVDVLVCGTDFGVVPEIGMGGSCFKRSLVTISIDPDNISLEKQVRSGKFKQVLAHELHHSIRYNVLDYGVTLGEALVSEGLADHFACELLKEEPLLWTSGNPRNWPEILLRAELELESDLYNHAEWFFGEGTLPRWAGYATGFELIQELKLQMVVENGGVDLDSTFIMQNCWIPMKSRLLSAKQPLLMSSHQIANTPAAFHE
jgi:uncharacterized protein YjaZ